MSDSSVINGVLYVVGRKLPGCRCTCGDCWRLDADRPDPRDQCAMCLDAGACNCVDAFHRDPSTGEDGR